MKRNSLKQRNIINIMRSYGETQVLTTNSSIRVNFLFILQAFLYFFLGESRGGPPPLVPQQRRGITRLVFAYFLFPLKRK